MSTFRQKVQANTDWGKPDPVAEAPPRGRWKAARRAAAALGKRTDQPRRAAAAPVTSHRLFPAFAALWFAALFGLGSLAISSDVLGKLVVAIGLPALVPAAAPPFGLTAHLLVALALTVVGAALGLVLGLRLRPRTATTTATAAADPTPIAAESDETAVPKVRARDAHPDAPPRRPLVLTEAFDDPAETRIDQAQFDQPVAPAEPLLRRKPAETEPAPPGSVPETWIREYAPGGAGALEPLDLAALDFPEIVEAGEPEAFSAPDFAHEPEAAIASSPEAPEVPEAESRLDAAPEAAAVSDEVPDDTSGAMAEDIAPVAAPHAFSPEINDAPHDAPTDDAAAERRWPMLLAATPQVLSGFTMPLPGPDARAAGATWSPVAGAPLASLGLVQLIERLALAIAARKAAGDAGPPPSADGAVPDIAAVDSELPAGAAAAGELAVEGGAASEPEALEAEAPGPFSRPANGSEPASSARRAILRRLGAVQNSAPVLAVVEAPAVFTAEAGPGPFSRPVQTPPAADQPVPSPAASEGQSGPLETDEALRSALATLQRMSVRA